MSYVLLKKKMEMLTNIKTSVAFLKMSLVIITKMYYAT